MIIYLRNPEQFHTKPMKHLKEIPQASQAILQGTQSSCNKPFTHPQEILSKWQNNSWKGHIRSQEMHGESCGNPGRNPCWIVWEFNANRENILRRCIPNPPQSPGTMAEPWTITNNSKDKSQDIIMLFNTYFTNPQEILSNSIANSEEHQSTFEGNPWRL